MRGGSPDAAVPEETSDVVVVGAGAAGLAASIFIAGADRRLRVTLVDGADRLGAKILVSGGGRCNLTNRTVLPEDFQGGPRPVVASVLKAFTVPATLAFFESIGVEVREEEAGKLFPVTNRAGDVLAALTGACGRAGVQLENRRRVTAIEKAPDGTFVVRSAGHRWVGRAVVLATGGRSLPRTGSDGEGYRLASSMGHTIVAPCPALVPLSLDGGFHRRLAGVAQPVALTLKCRQSKPLRRTGSLLWTHQGISGPPVLDISRHWIRAREGGLDPVLTANLLPGEVDASLDATLVEAGRLNPRATIRSWLAGRMPAAAAEAVAEASDVAADTRPAHLAREARRRLVAQVLECPLAVSGHRGWDHAEVTAGGVALTEVRGQTLESRILPGLFFAGEMLDVDGRLGGFNFQWSWSSGWVAAAGCCQRLGAASPRRFREWRNG